MSFRHLIVTCLAALVMAAMTSCRSAAEPDTDGGPTGEVLVSAAASLSDVLPALAVEFESAYPGIRVTANFAGSSTLREQILAGAPVDVFAAADEDTMNALVEAGRIDGDVNVFASTRMTIAVPTGNPGDITGLEDFADSSLFIGVCAREVPCGRYARQVLDMAGVSADVDTEEPNVRALVTKVAVGELDAAIVYHTDITAIAEVESIDIAEQLNVTARYPIGRVIDGPNPTAAKAFREFVSSDRARSILAEWGFDRP